MTALVFGFPRTAEVLVRRGAPVKDVAAAAGLGRLDETARLLPGADAESKQVALALAAQLGHTDVVRLLLDAGEDPNRFNPDGFHSHATPLHQAVSSDHADVVRLLAERGARLNIQDAIFRGTPLDWAIYLERDAIADYLRAQRRARRRECLERRCSGPTNEGVSPTVDSLGRFSDARARLGVITYVSLDEIGVAAWAGVSHLVLVGMMLC